jgi:hypothetical protein
MKTTAIYGLFDPREPEVIFYVGKGLARRAACHWKNFRKYGDAVSGNLRRRFESLQATGVEPGWRFLEDNVSLDGWEEREDFWILHWREKNPQLCNVLLGGNQYPPNAGRIGGLNSNIKHKLHKKNNAPDMSCGYCRKTAKAQEKNHQRRLVKLEKSLICAIKTTLRDWENEKSRIETRVCKGCRKNFEVIKVWCKGTGRKHKRNYAVFKLCFSCKNRATDRGKGNVIPDKLSVCGCGCGAEFLPFTDGNTESFKAGHFKKTPEARIRARATELKRRESMPSLVEEEQRGNHKCWHLDRDRVNLKCDLCYRAAMVSACIAMNGRTDFDVVDWILQFRPADY